MDQQCRIAGNKLIRLFGLGNLYISDFIKNEEERGEEYKSPLTLCLSPHSGLVQLEDTPDFDKMYKRYWYFSGANNSMKQELKNIVDSIQTRRKHIGLWIDIGCNDGTLLNYVNNTVDNCDVTFGFDPAHNNIKLAEGKANLLIEDYFYYDALPSKAKVVKADVITSIAMFYDLDDPHTFIDDVYKALSDDGVWVIQMSYLPLMLKQLAFDNICHEHLEYYSLEVLKGLLDTHGFDIIDCQLNDTNGGSFRVYVMKKEGNKKTFGSTPYRDVGAYRISAYLEEEFSMHLFKQTPYLTFHNRVKKLKDETMGFIKEEKKKGKKIWAYGASTKGNTLLQYFGLTNEHIDAIAEVQTGKLGLRTIGSNIPIKSEDEMRKANPDYALVLPWHFIDGFIKRESEFLNNGGHFIVPCPKFEII